MIFEDWWNNRAFPLDDSIKDIAFTAWQAALKAVAIDIKDNADYSGSNRKTHLMSIVEDIEKVFTQNKRDRT